MASTTTTLNSSAIWGQQRGEGVWHCGGGAGGRTGSAPARDRCKFSQPGCCDHVGAEALSSSARCSPHLAHEAANLLEQAVNAGLVARLEQRGDGLAGVGWGGVRWGWVAEGWQVTRSVVC